MIHKFLLVIVFLSVSASAYAERQSNDLKVTSIINLYGVTFEHGSPPWVKKDTKTEDLLKVSKYFKDQKGPNFIWEAIPVNETFESWKTIYAVRALKVPMNVTLAKWENLTLNNFKRSCLDLQINYLHQQSEISLVQIICPQHIGTTEHGYSDKTGEIALFVFIKQEGVLISHYTEWRGKSFDYSGRDSWPVSEQIFEDAILNMKKARAVQGKKIVAFDD